MKNKFPELPKFEFAWRSLQIEPLPFSGEKITLGLLIKGGDKTLIAAKLVHKEKLKKMFGNEFGSGISDALSLCIHSAETYYCNKDLSTNWTPPLEGFQVGKIRSSVADNMEDAIFRAAMYCSSFTASVEVEKNNPRKKGEISAPESWRKNIHKAVTSVRADYANFFERSITIRGMGVPITYGFLSADYAAQFDAVPDASRIQQGLVRAQSKLWQLDRLRDEGTLFKPRLCELLLNIPSLTADQEQFLLFQDFVEELRYEAKKRDLNVFTSASASDAASHVIENAA